MAARIFVSSETADADLFLVVRVFDPDGAEVTFMGALDPNTPIAQGWLRASHRALDPAMSLALPSVSLPRPGRTSRPGRDL